jgi:DNA-binding protein HU-beta
MTKTQLVQVLAERMNLSKTQAALFIETLCDVAAETLEKEKEFTVPDFVKLILRDTPAKSARQGINPFTKEPMTIAAKPAAKKILVRVTGDMKKKFAAA